MQQLNLQFIFQLIMYPF